MSDSTDWQLLLKRCPDTEFIEFFVEHPAMLYAVDIAIHLRIVGGDGDTAAGSVVSAGA